MFEIPINIYQLCSVKRLHLGSFDAAEPLATRCPAQLRGMEWLEATARRLEFLKRKQRRAPGSELDDCRDQSVSCNDPKPEDEERETEREREREREKDRKRESSLSSSLKRETKKVKVAPPNEEVPRPSASPIILKARAPSPEANFGAATRHSAPAFTSNLETKASPGSQPTVAGPSDPPTPVQSSCPKCLFSESKDKIQAQKLRKVLVQIVTAQKKVAELQKALSAERQKSKLAEDQSASLQEQVNSMSMETAQLKAQLQMQKSASGISSGASWQYEMNNSWHEFTPEANEKMHQSYLKYLGGQDPDSRLATISSGGVSRTVDFKRMEQKHPSTQKVRRVRVLPGVPSQWITPAADLLQQGNDLSSFYKAVTDQKVWDSIRDILRNSGHAWDTSKECSQMRTAEVKSVHRIENFCLWHRYKARLTAMRQDHARYGISVGCAELDLDSYGKRMMVGYQQTFDCGEALAQDVDEKILLHGTSWDNANSIVREGFDNRTCQHAFYGAGVYFACAACKSHQYTCSEHKKCCDCECERTLIIARIALGDVYVATETRKDERRPPARHASSGTATGTYDSIVVKPGPIKGHHNWKQVHQEYVIFDREQAYPSYVVQYTV